MQDAFAECALGTLSAVLLVGNSVCPFALGPIEAPAALADAIAGLTVQEAQGMGVQLLPAKNDDDLSIAHHRQATRLWCPEARQIALARQRQLLSRLLAT